jgi:uncharacterized protein YihD (DUF1040 family)
MRDPNRIPRVLAKVQAYWEQHPDLRLAQLVTNMNVGTDAFYLEDDDLELALEEASRSHKEQDA